jgi:hypothetical protein
MMKKFLAVFLGTPASVEKAGWSRLEPGKRKEKEAAGLKAWGDWMVTHKAAVVEAGGPLGKTKRVAAEGVTDTKNALAGFAIVQAESHEAAAQMFENHPHFAIFPGEAVEIMEVLPIPGAG